MGQLECVEWPGAAEGDQREAAWIVTPLDAHQTNRAGHVGVDDRQHAFGGCLQAEPEWFGNARVDGLRGSGTVETDLAIQQLRWNAAQHKVRVGYGRLDATSPVAHRSWIG